MSTVSVFSMRGHLSSWANLLHILLVKNQNSELRAGVVSSSDAVVLSVNGAGLNLACVPDSPVPTKDSFWGEGLVPTEQESWNIEAVSKLACLPHSADTWHTCVQDDDTAWVCDGVNVLNEAVTEAAEEKANLVALCSWAGWGSSGGGNSCRSWRGHII